jgi:restriction system protein
VKRSLFNRRKTAGSGLVSAASCLSVCIRLMSRFVNAVRIMHLPSHAGNVRRSRQVLSAIRGFSEPGMAGRCFNYLRQVDPAVFEEVVLSALEDAGLFVLRNRRYSGDGGVDGACWYPGRGRMAVQVKRYRAHIVRQHVLEFGNVIRKRHLAGGLFVHTGRSGAGVFEYLAGSEIILLSGDRLIRLILERELTHWRAK